MRKILFAAAAAAIAAATPAAATVYTGEVPVTNYITFGGLDWAWASPCSPDGCWVGSGIDMSEQAGYGWVIATTAQLASGPAQSDFLDSAGSVICASGWFSSFTWCDYGNPVWNAGSPGGVSYSETWVVRGAATPGVPEPAIWGMLITGFGLVGAAVRRRATVVSA